MGAEELVAPSSRLRGQLLECHAEDKAIEDVLARIEEIERGQLGAADMLAEVERLAERQFRARALARKIAALLEREESAMKAHM
jgi:hypothetical protein